MSVLERLLSVKRAEVERLRTQRLPSPASTQRAVALSRPAGEPLRLIAEIKRRSPSAGALSTRLGVGERAAVYERAGARMVSVLCDREFFDGAYEHLAETRAACSLPILCKEFVIDEVQLDAARAYGADAVLVIVRCLAANELAPMVTAARERGLVPLVEVVTEAEAARALDAGADLIGVNARDLDTLEVDAERAARVLASLPATVTRVHLSGIRTAEDVTRVAASRADAVLIGEALMRRDDPEELLTEMAAACGT